MSRWGQPANTHAATPHHTTNSPGAQNKTKHPAVPCNQCLLPPSTCLPKRILHNCPMSLVGVNQVTDFGLARLAPGRAVSGTDPDALNTHVPVRWCSPEVLTQGLWSEKSDVWSFGVTMWEIFGDGAEPHARKTDAEVRSGGSQPALQSYQGALSLCCPA